MADSQEQDAASDAFLRREAAYWRARALLAEHGLRELRAFWAEVLQRVRQMGIEEMRS